MITTNVNVQKIAWLQIAGTKKNVAINIGRIESVLDLGDYCQVTMWSGQCHDLNMTAKKFMDCVEYSFNGEGK